MLADGGRRTAAPRWHDAEHEQTAHEQGDRQGDRQEPRGELFVTAVAVTMPAMVTAAQDANVTLLLDGAQKRACRPRRLTLL